MLHQWQQHAYGNPGDSAFCGPMKLGYLKPGEGLKHDNALLGPRSQNLLSPPLFGGIDDRGESLASVRQETLCWCLVPLSVV